MDDSIETVERHPFRFVFKLALFAGLVYLAGRVVAQKKDEYMGLTESEARSKFVEKAGPRIGEETAEEIADQVIPKLKEKGFVKPDEGASETEEPVAAE